MKQLLITIAALVLVGCSKPTPPDISIHKAARGRNIEAVKQHLAAGTDVNAKNKGDDTPLHIAAISGEDEIAELLIANGADVNAMNKHGETPLDHAGIFAETADLLRKHGGKWGVELKAEKSIYLAAESGNIEAVKKHLAAGTDVNLKNEEGDETTPLYLAAGRGHTEIVELLIANGVDVNAKKKMGETPLWNAIWGGHMELVELLIASDADVNTKLQNGKTSLDLAIDIINGNIYLHPPNSHAFDTYHKIADLLRKHGGKTGEELEAEGK